MPNVGVAFASIGVVTLGPAVPWQMPVAGVVWQIETLSGKLTFPVSAEAVIIAPAPTFTVATANTPTGGVVAAAAVGFGTFTIPSWLIVAAKATISGVGVGDADNRIVLRPTLTGAVPPLQWKM